MTITPNDALRAVRLGMSLSQDELARKLREHGLASASKKTVQRLENGEVVNPRPATRRALERITGLPFAQLGFSIPVPGQDTTVAADGTMRVAITHAGSAAMPAAAAQARANFTGIWLSKYEYHSSGRNETFAAAHFVVVIQHDNRLTVRSIPGGSTNPDSPLSMDLTVDGNVVTGTWVEQTAADGYYRGARYHGAIQMLVEPTGRRMTGKWVGFGTEMDINTGPWQLVFEDARVDKAAMESFARVPQA